MGALVVCQPAPYLRRLSGEAFLNGERKKSRVNLSSGFDSSTILKIEVPLKFIYLIGFDDWHIFFLFFSFY